VQSDENASKPTAENASEPILKNFPIKDLYIASTKRFVIDIVGSAESNADILSKLEVCEDVVFKEMKLSERYVYLSGELFLSCIFLLLSTLVVFSNNKFSIHMLKSLFYSAFVSNAYASVDDYVEFYASPKTIAMSLFIVDWFLFVVITGFSLWGSFLRRPPLAWAPKMLRVSLIFVTGQMTVALAVLGVTSGLAH
jgi:hypothetical protein